MKKAIPFIFVLALFGVAGWYFFTAGPEAVHEPPPPIVVPVTPVLKKPDPIVLTEAEQSAELPDILPPESESEPEPELLPNLVESDTDVKQALEKVVGADPLANYLVKNEVISRMVTTIDSLASRQVPPPANPIKPVERPFVTAMEGEKIVLSAENFSRYDGHIALMQNADTETLLLLYEKYYPLFQQAWEENGGEGSFNQRLVEVIDHLLETPDVPGPIYLTKPEAVYLYEAPELEAMTAGQKILVRMGIFNAALVKEKLTEVRNALAPSPRN